MTVLRVWVDMPEPPPLVLFSASPGVAVVTTSVVRVENEPSLLVTVSTVTMVLVTGLEDSWLGGFGAGVVSPVGGWVGLLVGVFGLSDVGVLGGGVVLVVVSGGGAGVEGSEGFGGSELGGGGGGLEVGVGEAVGVLVSEFVALGLGVSSSACRCCIAFTFRTSSLPLTKVASATERAESPITRRSRSRLECILNEPVMGRGLVWCERGRQVVIVGPVL